MIPNGINTYRHIHRLACVTVLDRRVRGVLDNPRPDQVSADVLSSVAEIKRPAALARTAIYGRVQREILTPFRRAKDA